MNGLFGAESIAVVGVSESERREAQTFCGGYRFREGMDPQDAALTANGVNDCVICGQCSGVRLGNCFTYVRL